MAAGHGMTTINLWKETTTAKNKGPSTQQMEQNGKQTQRTTRRRKRRERKKPEK